MNKYIYGLGLVAALSLTASCDDFLTEEPKFSQSNELQLSTFDGVDQAVQGAYGLLQSEYYYGAQFVLDAELRAGNARNPRSVSGSGRYRESPFWNFNESSTSPCWSRCYYIIARANNAYNALEGNPFTAAGDQAQNNLKAECLFLRALAHFDLVRTYAQPYTYDKTSLGVPYVTKTEMGSPSRDDVETVYNHVVADLLEAESLMADGYTRSDVDDKLAVASKPAIQALLSRVYLYMGEWQKAADYATKVISSGKFQLVDADAYQAMWTQSAAQAGGEIIFEMYGTNKNDAWPSWTCITYVCQEDGYGDVCASNDLYELYEDGDVRKTLFTASSTDATEFFTLKYAGKAGSGTPAWSNVPIIRLAEMYLNRAEAIQNGAVISGVTAQSDLNAITDARGASRISSPSRPVILQERRKELGFEGHYVFDLARTGTSLERKDYDGVTNQNIAFPGFQWAMPIPRAEILANPNMVQNPGY